MQKRQLHLVPFDLKQPSLLSKAPEVKNPNWSDESTMPFSAELCANSPSRATPVLEHWREVPADGDEEHQIWDMNVNRLSPTSDQGAELRNVPTPPLLYPKYLCQAWFWLSLQKHEAQVVLDAQSWSCEREEWPSEMRRGTETARHFLLPWLKDKWLHEGVFSQIICRDKHFSTKT